VVASCLINVIDKPEFRDEASIEVATPESPAQEVVLHQLSILLSDRFEAAQWPDPDDLK